MKRKADFKLGVLVWFEVIKLESIYVKDGMKKIRHSRVRMLQGIEGGKTESFLISLDDMFLFRAVGPSLRSRQGSGRRSPESR